MVYNANIPVNRMARHPERNILKYVRKGALQPEGVVEVFNWWHFVWRPQYSTAVTVIIIIIKIKGWTL